MVTLAVDDATSLGTWVDDTLVDVSDDTLVDVSDESLEAAMQTLTDRQTPK
jgi:hypothetical protein